MRQQMFCTMVSSRNSLLSELTHLADKAAYQTQAKLPVPGRQTYKRRSCRYVPPGSRNGVYYFQMRCRYIGDQFDIGILDRAREACSLEIKQLIQPLTNAFGSGVQVGMRHTRRYRFESVEHALGRRGRDGGFSAVGRSKMMSHDYCA